MSRLLDQACCLYPADHRRYQTTTTKEVGGLVDAAVEVDAVDVGWMLTLLTSATPLKM